MKGALVSFGSCGGKAACLRLFIHISRAERGGEGREATGNVVNSTPPESRKWRRCRPGDPIPMFTVYSRERGGARSRGESRTWKSEYTSSVGEELYWRCRSTIMHRGKVVAMIYHGSGVEGHNVNANEATRGLCCFGEASCYVNHDPEMPLWALRIF